MHAIKIVTTVCVSCIQGRDNFVSIYPQVWNNVVGTLFPCTLARFTAVSPGHLAFNWIGLPVYGIPN